MRRASARNAHKHLNLASVLLLNASVFGFLASASGYVLAQISIALTHALLGQPLVSVGSQLWEVALSDASVAVCVLGCWAWATRLAWPSFKSSPSPDTRALARSLESRWRILTLCGAPQVLEMRHDRDGEASHV